MRSGRGGQPSQATPTATPSRARRTASLVRNMSVGRPASAAPTATRNATVTFSVSSSPVVRLMTALPAMAAAPPRCRCVDTDDRDGGAGIRPEFPLQIDRFEGVEQAVLHGKQRGGRSGRRAGLGIDALDVGLGRLGGDGEMPGDLARRRATGDECEHLDLPWGQTGRSGAPLAVALAAGG